MAAVSSHPPDSAVRSAIGASLRVFSASFLALTLTACGGGSGGSDGGNDNNNNGGTPIIPAPAQMTLSGDTTANQGDSVGVVASLDERGYNRFEWEQLSGPDVMPLAGNGTAGISFDAVFSGEYRFRVTASNPEGSSVQDTFNISVAPSSASTRVQFRADRAVSEGAEFSLRLNASEYTGYVNSWHFEQLSGPLADMVEDDSDHPVVFVTAPRVSGDQVLTFRAILETSAGTFSDTAYVVVQDRPEANSDYFCDGDDEYCAKNAPLNPVYSYRADSPYRDVLAGCVYSNQLNDNNLCTLRTLPPIGLVSSAPTVDQVMDHVLVSHDWMGERFERFLTELDNHGDFARLLRSVTAIVISSDVRPSFYWSLTGAIYLDPDSLWMSPAERDVINEQPDYRSGFSSALDFVTPWRYVKNNNYVFTNYEVQERFHRGFAELEADLGSLMYHELAHAADALSPAKINSGLDRNDIFFNQAGDSDFVNKIVSAVNPMYSTELYALAEVRYRGAEASAAQRAYGPADIAGFFFPDSANDFYSYSSPWEDTAMLFEETMMSLRYGIKRDIAVTNRPYAPLSADDYIVSRGQRARIASERIRPRASTAVRELLPEAWAEADAHLNSILPTALCAGEGWGQNLNPACEGASGLLRFEAPAPNQRIPMPVERPRSLMPPTRY